MVELGQYKAVIESRSVNSVVIRLIPNGIRPLRAYCTLRNETRNETKREAKRNGKRNETRNETKRETKRNEKRNETKRDILISKEKIITSIIITLFRYSVTTTISDN